jgi:undecaprenyl diphosphate synthase
VVTLPPKLMLDSKRIAEPGSPDEPLARRLDLERLPRHVAVIMDGNGRWARERGLSRSEGHRAGVKAVFEALETAARLELEVLTLYAFSVENLKRPKAEVWTLMSLLREHIQRDLGRLVDGNIRLRVIGRWRELQPPVVKALERALAATAGCTGMTLNVALNYSGRCEIVDACRSIVTDWAAGKQAEIDEATIGRYLYTSEQPDPDLIIRTSGEFRVSNFLLWQLAYAEIWLTERYWPDFRRRDFLQAILDFQSRRRRFGGVDAVAEGPAPAGIRRKSS